MKRKKFLRLSILIAASIIRNLWATMKEDGEILVRRSVFVHPVTGFCYA